MSTVASLQRGLVGSSQLLSSSKRGEVFGSRLELNRACMPHLKHGSCRYSGQLGVSRPQAQKNDFTPEPSREAGNGGKRYAPTNAMHLLRYGPEDRGVVVGRPEEEAGFLRMGEALRCWMSQALRPLPALVLGLGVMLSLRPGHALAEVANEIFSPQGKGLLASAWAGLVAGGLHTLTGPDHLAALAPLCIGRSRVQSAAVGALWGCGHDAGQIIFGLIFLVLKDKLHIELIRLWASRVVGLTLITIGGVGIYESQETVEVLAEATGPQDRGDSQVRMKNDSKHATTFATGVVYGLQPDALLMILPALALPSRATGAAFLIMFLLGTVIAMGSYTLFIASCSRALQKRLPGITKNLTIASSIIAIALGLGLVASELFGLSIF